MAVKLIPAEEGHAVLTKTSISVAYSSHFLLTLCVDSHRSAASLPCISSHFSMQTEVAAPTWDMLFL